MSDPGLPAPEAYMAASPLEIEMQEAIRNGLTVQRDLWGSHFLQNWGTADPLGVARDNRGAELFTQWLREWPSWIGHRYLTLSLDEGQNGERVALEKQFEAQGGTIPSTDDLTWARNHGNRVLVTDGPVCPNVEIAGIGADAKGNVYIASRDGTLVEYGPGGAIVRQVVRCTPTSRSLSIQLPQQPI